MTTLYRSSLEPQHWLVWADGLGWMRFPARVGGWDDRNPVPSLSRRGLQAVPLWLAFNTGLLEDLRLSRFVRAA
ncbi:MAG TPA: hypothetical protein VMH28_00405 [Candidatus Acidoferrales bacterium]|nr:hypothetical protein [Candidatus Acidoferrales bacterium]